MKLSTTNHTPVLKPPPVPLDAPAQIRKSDRLFLLDVSVVIGGIFLLTIMDCFVFANVNSIVKAVLLVVGFVAVICAFITIFFFSAKSHNMGVAMAEKNTQKTEEWKQNDLIPYLNETYGVEVINLNENMVCQIKKDGKELTALLRGVDFEEVPGYSSYVYASVNYDKLGLALVVDMPKNN